MTVPTGRQGEQRAEPEDHDMDGIVAEVLGMELDGNDVNMQGNNAGVQVQPAQQQPAQQQVEPEQPAEQVQLGWRRNLLRVQPQAPHHAREPENINPRYLPDQEYFQRAERERAANQRSHEELLREYLRELY